MRGPKLNEGATVATMTRGERHGTKATAKYVRSSAYKARVVLDLIRGLDVRRADEVLQFTERGIARDIGYWDAPGKAHSGGRVQDTCLCTLQLEVYYRYLPTFKAPVADAEVEKEIVSEDDIKIDFDEG